MTDLAAAPPPHAVQRRTIYRHALVVRITHWINAACILFLVMSGLQIFNAHPHLYWGETSTFNENNIPIDTWLSIGTITNAAGETRGVTQLFGGPFMDTTGVLGVSTNDGRQQLTAFPGWLTIPSTRDLATGRLWHFLFAWIFVINGAVYLLYGFAGHFWRDLLPKRDQWRSIGRTILDHARLRFHHPGDTRYNILQKLTYLVLGLALIMMVLSGLSMSPGINAAMPWLHEAMGGRQSARSIHFISATLVVLIVLVHILLVLVSGVWNNVRSMITGRYVVKEAPHDPAHRP